MTIKPLNSFLYRGMLSNAVQPPTTEHVYAQWQEREELSSMGPLGLLQEDDGQSFDVKEEDAVALVSAEPTSQNHFRSSRALRLRGKAVKKEGRKLSFFSFNFVLRLRM